MKTAEWWINECGGVFCSNCGLYHDDYYEPAPDKCEKCGSTMSSNTEIYVDNYYRLSCINSTRYFDDNKCPDWLLKKRKEISK